MNGCPKHVAALKIGWDLIIIIIIITYDFQMQKMQHTSVTLLTR